MHRKTHVVTTTLIGGLIFAVPALADHSIGEAAHDTAQDVRSGVHEGANTVRNGTVRTTRAIDTRVQTARGGGETASTTRAADCPAGCVAVHHYTPEQVAAMRRARDERRERLAREQAERDQMRADLENCRTRSQQLEAEAQQLRGDAERDRLARAEQERADAAKRAEAARLSQRQYYAPYPGYYVNRARGGGPNSTHGVHLQFGLEGGLGGYTGAAQNIAYVGPAWGARVGVHFMNWFAIEGRYFGMWNNGYDPNVQPNVGVVTNEGAGVLRFMIPTPYVRPYAFAGAGYAWNTRTWTDSNSLQASPLRDNRSFVVPAGGGIDVPIGRRWGVGFEGMYHWYLDPNFTTQTQYNSGGQWSTGMNVHVAI